MIAFTRWPGVAATAIALLVVNTPARSAIAGNPPAENGVVRVQVIGTAGTSEGTCFLVRNERIQGGVVQYFVTAAHLFSAALVGDQSVDSLRIRLMPADGPVIEVNGTHALFPGGMDAGVDVAVLRIAASSTRLTPVNMSIAAPDVGGVFMIRGPGSSMLPASVERVRFRSSRLVTGDRAVTETAGLVGAPAIAAQGAFGVTSSFGPNRIPVVALLAGARDFLDRAVPSWDNSPAVRPTFNLSRRTIEGPLLTVACDATSTGDVEVPVPLRPSERLVDADARLTNRSQLRLGDLTILSLEDRSVKLRFTLKGIPPPLFAPPTPCPKGQALVTVGVDVLSVPH